MMTGNTNPRLANEDVKKLLAPIADEATQKRIVQEQQRRRERARTLKQQAEALWIKAKQDFETALLGKSD